MTITEDVMTPDVEPTDLAALVHCQHCGRDGWHDPDRCPQLRGVALPRGAVFGDVFEGGRRVVFGAPHRVRDGLLVEAAALQNADGSINVDKFLRVLVGRHYELTAAEARELSRALAAAADVLDDWFEQTRVGQ